MKEKKHGKPPVKPAKKGSTKVVSLYVTVPSRDEALDIARKLVKERLAACVNVIEGVTSVYRWEGEQHEDPECVLFIKTNACMEEAVIQRVKELHDYERPCIVTIPISGGNDDFLKWVASATKVSYM